ncbi:unnamed protein product [Polarella glacialis]|uniref:Uncharacterized protein n=1 Tax=Polarella glacialis TaxID=89957 RepID=A0A813KGB4_POLGL|nr:unnamed protein product [Polarella glacialis]
MAAPATAPAMQGAIPFTVTVSKLSGESEDFEGLVADMQMFEFRGRVAKKFEVANFEMLLALGEQTFVPSDDGSSLSELGIGEGSTLVICVMSWVRDLVGSWEPAREDRSEWMAGLKIAEDGTFVCKSGCITDGVLRVLSVSQRQINLKRTCVDPNDHVFLVDEQGGVMKGRCTQSGQTYTLTKQP